MVRRRFSSRTRDAHDPGTATARSHRIQNQTTLLGADAAALQRRWGDDYRMQRMRD